MPRQVTAFSNETVKRLRSLRDKKHRREEGLFLGGSSGINVGAAVALAREMGPGHTIVTLLCDRGDLYMGRLFNEAWLAGKGLQPIPFRRVGPGV